jgi:hypothetical protein
VAGLLQLIRFKHKICAFCVFHALHTTSMARLNAAAPRPKRVAPSQ